VSALFVALGAIVVRDSLRLGAQWASDGPQPGYFPFYVGILICLSSLGNALRVALVKRGAERVFVHMEALRKVLAVLIPTAIFAAAVGWIGIYVAAALFTGFFMRVLGGARWISAASVALGQSALLFCLFERWFQVPLPKGPLETWLGLD